jgi:transposase
VNESRRAVVLLQRKKVTLPDDRSKVPWSERRFEDRREGGQARCNVVEQCVNRLEKWRGVATRYEKRAINYGTMVIIASHPLRSIIHRRFIGARYAGG